MTGLSLCCLTDGKGWECCAAFPRRHIRHGDPSSRLYGRCLKHRRTQCSSPAALARNKADVAVRGKMKRGTAKESERQTTKKAKRLGRIRPTGNLRTLLRRLRSTFEVILAKSAQGKLFVTTMKTIDCFLEKPSINAQRTVASQLPTSSSYLPTARQACPSRRGCLKSVRPCTPVQAKTSPRAGFAAMSGIGQVGSW